MDVLFLLQKISILTVISFVVTTLLVPFFTNFLYRNRLGKQIRVDPGAPIFTSLHQKKEGTPTMGGLIVWGTTLGITLLFFVIDSIWPESIFGKLNFLSRSQTYLPLGILVFAGLIGMADDLFGVFKKGILGGGIRFRHRFILYLFIAVIGAWWFFYKLEWDILHIPFVGNFNVGIWYIPIFIFIMIASSFSTNQTDGLDGLAGGILLVAFVSLGIISFVQEKYELAAFIGVLSGALLSFLWFNIYPARFFMGDTGSMSLGATLGVITMLTNTVFLLPLFGIILVIESLSTIIQIFSKRVFKRKVFLSAPIHHHFEALGWPETKVTMRFWIISVVCAIIGVTIFFLENQLM